MYIDQNSARLNDTSPIEPLLRSVELLQPKFDFASVSLVTDRNNLRKLLRWVTRQSDRPFRIEVERAGDAVVFRRWEPCDTDEFEEGYRGYSGEFKHEQLETTPGTTGSHRITRSALQQNLITPLTDFIRSVQLLFRSS